MRSYGRRLFNGLAAISFLVWMISVGFYIWSLDWGHAVGSPQHSIEIFSEQYALGWVPSYFEIWRIGPIPLEGAGPVYDAGMFDWNHHIGFAGVHAEWWSGAGIDRVTYVWLLIAISFWWIILTTSVLPGWWAIRRFQSHSRNSADRCIGCGYDLRATPERCPECGRLVEKTAKC
jgi:hypothetical protein